MGHNDQNIIAQIARAHMVQITSLTLHNHLLQLFNVHATGLNQLGVVMILTNVSLQLHVERLILIVSLLLIDERCLLVDLVQCLGNGCIVDMVLTISYKYCIEYGWMDGWMDEIVNIVCVCVSRCNLLQQ